MPAFLDAPAENSSFDPADFSVRGWLWLAKSQPDLAAVEAWSDTTLLGETATLNPRPDVTAALALPAHALTGFELRAHHPSASLGDSFGISLCARFHDGTRSPVLATKHLTALIASAHPLGALRAALSPSAVGLEIGAHALPTPGLSPYFTDAVATFAGSAGRVDFLADARALPLATDTLDYLCSSHVIEHLSDPVAALHEWHRVLRPGGFLYLVAPDKRFTFDAPRPVTPVAHLLADFAASTTVGDSVAHVDEFIYQTDWEKLQPGTPPAEKSHRQAAHHAHYLREIAAGRMIDIHFHTFTPDSLHALLVASGFLRGTSPRFELVAQAERYPADRADGIAVLLCKRSSCSPPPPAALAPETVVLQHSDPTVAHLPLVCPITLAALRPTTDSSGQRALHSTTGDHSYKYHGAFPNLLAPTGVPPIRAWRIRN